MRVKTSLFFELALVLVRVDHVARFIVKPNHGIRGTDCEKTSDRK